MKNKEAHDPFDMASWSREGITDPQQVFDEVFFYSDIKNLRREIKKITSYALLDKLYRRQVPCDVLLDMKVMRSMLKAAHALKNATGSEITIAEGETFYPCQYCSGLGRLGCWGDFPRNLSFKEYCQPYRVFKKLFRQRSLNEWVRNWEALVQGALSPCHVVLQVNPLCIGTHLQKLAEAAHLVWVREGAGGLKTSKEK